eukprot:jgi/Sobl393_1/19202/SZX60596.1
MFAFTDPDPANAGLLQHMARQYAAQLPTYLGVPPGSLAVQRGVFGVVPCYSSRTPPLVDRLLPVADAAGNRSALSLAGFCALLRHLPRLTGGIREALAAGALSKQELGLLQPWCPGVAASTAMQRTMAVYSCQAPTIRGSSSSSSSSAQPGRSSSNSSAAVSGSEVLDMMGASFSAMWGAVGAAGMAPFVADRLQWGPLAAGMAAQARADLPQLLSYSRFLNDTRSAPRLLAGLAGLAACSALHAATPLTGPLHEALLSRLSPRLLYAWHRYADAWRYGSGADWAPAAAAAAADTGAAPSGARDVTHSVDKYEDSLLPPGGYEGADADDALCRPDSPLCNDAMHSVDSTEVIDWGLEAGQGWGQHSSGSRSGSGVAAACSSGCSSGSSRPASKQAAVWGGSVLPAVHCSSSSSSSRSQMLRARPVAMAASNGSSSSSGDSGSSSGGDKNAALHRQQRRALEQLLLSIVVHEEHGRHRSTGESRDVVSIAEPGPGGDVSHYEGADAARLLYPQLDPARSYDEYDVIDWSDVANDGWGSSSTSGSGGSRRQCCNTRPAGSSSSSSRMNPVAWGGSMCRAGWLPGTTSSRQQQRRVAAAAAAGGAGGNSNAAHSVDTYEDSLLPPGGYEGADAADDALCRPDSPLCEDPGHSVDSTEVINWEREAGQGSTSSTRAAAAAASASNRSAAKDATHSVDTYEDSLLSPGGYEGADADDALRRPDSPLCEDPGHSVDSTEVQDWSSQPNQGFGSSKSSTTAAAAGSGSSAGMPAGHAAHSVDTYEDSLLPPGGYEGADADDALCRPDSPLCEDPGHSVDSTEIIDWSAQRSSSSRGPVVAAAAADSSASNAGRDATHSVDTYEDSLLPPGGYEGADADDALCRPDSPLCEDPGHSVDSTEVIDWADEPSSSRGQQQEAATSAAAAGSASSSLTAAAAEPGTASVTSSLPADPSYRKKHDGGQQQQQQVAAPRPWMNIVGGRWVPPSREESEAMMRGSVEVGPDEGV